MNTRYREINVQEEPDKEKQLRNETGTIIVPAFIFTETRLMFLKEKKVLIGFENNKEKIKHLVKTVTR